MPLIQAKCTNCGAKLQVDSTKDAQICSYCNTAFIVEKAINNYNIANAQIKTDVVNVQSGATVDNLLKLAEKELELKNIQEAENYCKRALELDPNNYKAWLLRIKTKTSLDAELIINYYNYAYDNAPASVQTDIRKEVKAWYADVLIKNFLHYEQENTLIDKFDNLFSKFGISLEKYIDDGKKYVNNFIYPERINKIMANLKLSSLRVSEHGDDDDQVSRCWRAENELRSIFFRHADETINKQINASIIEMYVRIIAAHKIAIDDSKEFRKKHKIKGEDSTTIYCNKQIKLYKNEIIKIDPNYVISDDVIPEEPSKRCYIATAVYGSYDAPQVLVLRRYRDDILVKSAMGRLFIKCYYLISPPLARRLKYTLRLNSVVRRVLDKLVIKLTK